MPERKNEAIWIESRGRWQINVQMDGVRKTFTCATPGRKGKATAERKAEEWLNGMSLTSDSNIGLLLDQYIKYQKETKTWGHVRQYESYIRIHIKPIIGVKRMSKLTEGDLQAVIDMAYAKHNLAAKTLKNIRACMMNWLKWCRKRGLTKMYVEELVLPAGARKSEKTVVQPEGLKILFSVDTSMRYGAPRPDWYIHAYRFSVLTGIRPGELLGLERQDVDGAKITIRRSYNIHGEITQGKNDNARRTIYLSERAQSELKAQMEMLQQYCNVATACMFPNRNGARPPEPTLYRAWQRYCRSNGIPPVSLYELRHTYISVNKKMPEGLKKMVVGHSRDMDTEGVYGHQMAGDLERAAQYTNAAFDDVLTA